MSHPEAPENPASPIAMTVHGVPLPDARRTSGRLQMLLVVACCAAPVVASYVTYFLIKPEGRTNYGDLIPPSPIPEQLPLKRLSGEVVAPLSLKGQWIIAVVADGACNATCENNLLIQRQLREAIGRDKDRIDKVWFVTDDAIPPPAILQSIAVGEPTQVFRVPRAELAQWLKPAEGQAIERHLYIIDPRMQWMMRAPPNPNPTQNWAGLSKFKKDIERLLRASASWDQPGR